jgi:hypothetical protein
MKPYHTPKSERDEKLGAAIEADYTCYCPDEEHETCYDGLVGIFDINCTCCLDTARDLAEFPNG